MARIKGIDIPNEKHVSIALTSIYGIGRNLAKTICEDAKVDPTKKAKDLDNEELVRLRDEVNKYTTEGDLRREINMNIKTKMEINSYEGTRHKKGLPVRGQRTSRNARTRKGKPKTIANKKK
ncbi:MAG: 30S ribosomal protein S13 [Firmicutes bacterium]|nr:30S ribosomal protein S13 [Bacillota bacterium]